MPRGKTREELKELSRKASEKRSLEAAQRKAKANRRFSTLGNKAFTTAVSSSQDAMQHIQDFDQAHPELVQKGSAVSVGWQKLEMGSESKCDMTSISHDVNYD